MPEVAMKQRRWWVTVILLALAAGTGQATVNPLVRLETSKGNILLELDPNAPITVDNFLSYVQRGF